MMKTSLLLGAAVILLSACGTFVANGPNDAMTHYERHPITVDQQTMSLAVTIDSTSHGLSRGQLAEIDNLVTAYRTRGHGPITVTAPAGTVADLDAAQTAADVRAALNSFGIDYRDIQGASVQTAGRPDAVIVSFTRYVASGPECGLFKSELSSRLRNIEAPNFGCADQHNLAAMVADPRDLTRMQSAAPTMGASATNPITAAQSAEGSVNEAGLITMENQ